ncbi:hypothetical protein [Tenacibaculum agarivorans]|uniref:hypothetical protein n=1 Tax=Tenacibaculum agarivorans TaxID=1908389 RepID=UPI00094B9E5B|nr:hypothetical protein [Tenacibaculum agarivorans]
MNRHIIFLVLTLLFLTNCTDCKKNQNLTDIKSIEFYFTPLDILSPVDGFDEKSITTTFKHSITEKTRIDEILKLIKSLEVSNDELIKKGIYLRADFINEKGVRKILLFDKMTFKLGNCSYKDDDRLFQTITRGFKWGG